MGERSRNVFIGLVRGGLLSAALVFFGSCASKQSEPAPAPASDKAPAPPAQTGGSSSANQNGVTAEPLQGARFGTRLGNQAVTSNANNSNTNARGATKKKSSGANKR